MMQKPKRLCDYCQQVIAWGDRYLTIRYALHVDTEPHIGSQGSSSITASNEVDVHEACCSPDLFLLQDLQLRAKHPDRQVRNRWSHDGLPDTLDVAALRELVGQKGSRS